MGGGAQIWDQTSQGYGNIWACWRGFWDRRAPAQGPWDFFQAVVQAVLFIWFREVGADPLHGKFPEKIPAQGLQSDDGDATGATGGGGG